VIEINYKGKRYVSKRFIAEQIGVSRTTVDKWERDEWLPKPINLGTRFYYPWMEIEAKIEARINE
jgi:predicted DNA-binding transcriptional regulator AlpA